MSATVTEKYLMAPATSAFLNYLHLDVAVTGLTLLFVLAGGWANSLAAFRNLDTAWRNATVTAAATPLLREEGPATPGLTPAMKAALDYVVQRYRVSADALLPVFETVQSVARERRLDPLLLIAVISVESRFNPFSQSPMGAQGLMQIIPRYHLDKVENTDAEQPFLDPIINVQVGARILHEAIQRQGGVMEGLQYYAGAVDDDEQAYASKVLAEKLRLEQARRRTIGADS